MTHSNPSSHTLKLRTLKLPLTLAVSSCLLVACNTAPKAPPIVHTPVAVQPTPIAVQPIIEAQPIINAQPVAVEAANIWDTPATDSALLDAETLAILDDLLEARDMSMVEGDRLSVQRYGDLWDRIRNGYRMSTIRAFHPRIEAQKNWFISRQSYLDRLTARSSRYLYHTVTEAERRGIPTELALLPIIESSYDPSATSNAAAAGLWQFIPSTGRIYGLNQSTTYDGRRDVIESTRAAYDFLTSLYNQFGSWELALAAYNAGPGRIQKAIDANAAQGLPTDFWSLRLPTETMNYVPRFLAVAQIVANPSHHGVSLPAIANHAHFRTVPVPTGISLYDVSIVTNVPVAELQLLNPALLNLKVEGAGANRVVIPNSVDTAADSHLSSFGGTMVRAPVEKTQYVVPQSVAVVNPSSTQELRASNTLPTTTAQVTPNRTIIQEPPLSLEERDFIAQQIRENSPTTVRPINPQDGNIELNAVQTAQSVLETRGEKRVLQYDRLSASAQPVMNVSQNAMVPPAQPIHMPSTPAQVAKDRSSTYVVQRGDTLSGIAERYGVTVADLRAWNQMSPNSTLYANTRLKVVGTPVSQSTNQSNRTTSRSDSHTVVSGDTLIGVAAQYGLTTAQLASYNNLPTNARIIAGNKLWLVPGKVASQTSQSTRSKAQTTYKVQAGDTLIGLASRFDTTPAEIAALNSFGATDGLIAGHTINLPGSANVSAAKKPTRQVRPETYKVQAGDTLIGLASRFDTTPAEIAALNSFGATDGLIAGHTINLPGSANKTSQTQTAASGQTIKNTENYKIKAGDTLTSLAASYGVSISDLAKTNNISSSAKLIAGQSLKVPKLTATHTVRSGESLNSLARRYKTTVAELATMNNLKPTDGLKINQKLTVPNN